MPSRKPGGRARAVRAEHRYRILPAAGTRLESLLENGGPILVTGRFSTSAGRAAYARAAKNARTAAAAQAQQNIVDLRPVLPSKAALALALSQTGDVVRSEDVKGRAFTNRFHTVDLPDGVTVHISAGSGRKIDQNTLHQTAVLRWPGKSDASARC